MVVVAQLVRAPGCGPGGRGFKSPHPPHLFLFPQKPLRTINSYIYAFLGYSLLETAYCQIHEKYRQLLEHKLQES